MENLEQELGALRSRIENIHLDMVELRDDLKILTMQVSMGRGAVKVLGNYGNRDYRPEHLCDMDHLFLKTVYPLNGD